MKSFKQFLPEDWSGVGSTVEPGDSISPVNGSNGRPELKFPDDQKQPVKEDAEDLNIGDDVIITGNVQFKGSTGVIDSFSEGNRFVVVNLYNHGRRSFHSSDVSLNDYADSDEEEADAWERDPDARAWAHGNELDEGTRKYVGVNASVHKWAEMVKAQYPTAKIYRGDEALGGEYDAWVGKKHVGNWCGDGSGVPGKILAESTQINEDDYSRAYALGKEHGITGQKRQPPWPKGFPYDLMHKAYTMGYNEWRQKPAKKVKVGESTESAEDIDRQIEFHKQGQAAAQYKGPMNKKHAAKIRDLTAKKEALSKKDVSEGLEDIKRLAGLK